ncbi:MAG: cyclic pyranopterin monophosphate synthase MoaC [Candidatus Heimdallarchaeota archaeon]|nr:cyclic pyranopterin monophosphate synthase MoaC [Candidatus Heimdallarchaeota archaeon]
MIDITDKKPVYREAKAFGRIILKKDTINKIREGSIKKGDPLVVAEVACLNAVKQTHLLIPMCHQLLLNTIKVAHKINKSNIEVTVTVKTDAKTGVEMEALVGVSIFLNNVWDMVKYLEKDENGQYPETRIEEIIVLNKIKK